MFRLHTLASTVLAALIVGGGCGGGGSYRAGRYTDAEAAYRIGDPGEGWRRVGVEDQNDLAWAHDALSAVVQVNASCDPDLDIPLVALTNHLLIGFTDRDLESQEIIAMDSREALRTHVRARLDGVPREILLHVLKKDGCVYDFALVAPPGERFGSARTGYESLVAGFATGAPR